MSLGIYGFVLTQVPVPVPAPPPPIPSLLLWALSGVLVLASVVAVPIWTRSMQRQMVLRSPQRPEHAALAAYQTGLILRLALAEAVALLGFVDAFSVGRPLDYVSSGVLAALVMLWHFPTERRAFGR